MGFSRLRYNNMFLRGKKCCLVLNLQRLRKIVAAVARAYFFNLGALPTLMNKWRVGVGHEASAFIKNVQ